MQFSYLGVVEQMEYKDSILELKNEATQVFFIWLSKETT